MTASPRPNWLSKQDPRAPGINKHTRRSILYYRALYAAWPMWARSDRRVAEIYARARNLRKRGFDVEVDHIVPISSPRVCGLHVPWNLAIVPSLQNRAKSNHTWPGHPDETIDMFGTGPEQLKLI